MACFAGGPHVVAGFRERFRTDLPDDAVEDFVDQLIMSAAENVSSTLYDQYQYWANGIL